MSLSPKAGMISSYLASVTVLNAHPHILSEQVGAGRRDRAPFPSWYRLEKCYLCRSSCSLYPVSFSLLSWFSSAKPSVSHSLPFFGLGRFTSGVADFHSAFLFILMGSLFLPFSIPLWNLSVLSFLSNTCRINPIMTCCCFNSLILDCWQLHCLRYFHFNSDYNPPLKMLLKWYTACSSASWDTNVLGDLTL